MLVSNPGSHSPKTETFNDYCIQSQLDVVKWLTTSNSLLHAQLQDINNRISFIEGRLANLKSRKANSDRQAASNYGKIRQAEGDLLERLALKAEVTESIVANYEIAFAARDSWDAVFNELCFIYFRALQNRARRLLKLKINQEIQPLEVPLFESVQIELRQGFVVAGHKTARKKG
jgi:phosphoenolpyruvate-protein kinase (PTS system EI component)